MAILYMQGEMSYRASQAGFGSRATQGRASFVLATGVFLCFRHLSRQDNTTIQQLWQIV